MTSPTPGETASNAVQVRDLARVLRPETDLFDPANLRKATVVSVAGTNPPSVNVNLSGSSEVINGIAIINGYSPYVGDVVIVAKQGSGLLVLGSVSESGGWTQATLLSGYGHNGNGGGNVMYRRVWDGGWKMEWKGVCTRSGGIGDQIIDGLAAEFRPATTREVLCSQEDEGIKNESKLEFTGAGNVFIDGRTASHGVNTFSHSHGGFTGGGQSIPNTQITPSTWTNDPGWLSFEGISYYL